MSKPLVSIVIATYNMGHLIRDTIKSCHEQDYDNLEIIVYDDCSTDNTQEILDDSAGIRYYRAERNAGVGAAFNEGMKLINGKYFVLMCADDLFTTREYISDVVREFEEDERLVHVTRFYYQFIDGDQRPVRAWRDDNPIILANQPSGLAFRASKLNGSVCSNKMFIETSYLASDMMKKGLAKVLPYDAIAARVHASTSTQPGYWLKRRVSSPVMDWHEIGGKEIAKDYVSFIQIRNGFKLSAVFEEIRNFIKLRPINAINPVFWFWALVAILTPRKILMKLPGFYRKHIGQKITKEIKREKPMTILNLGAGAKIRKEAINVDVTDYKGIDMVVDLGKYPWPWADGSIDGIHADHVIEHLEDPYKFIRECIRVLKKGGFLRMCLPHSSSVTNIGCFGHYRTFSYNTMEGYLGRDFYVFGKAPFKTVERRLSWWFEHVDGAGELPPGCETTIKIINGIISPVANICPRLWENIICPTIQMREVIWKGIKL